MDRTVNLRSYLPDTFSDFAEYRKIHSSEEPELSALWLETEKLLNRTFLDLTDSTGISRFESMMGIVPIEGDDIESRRLRLKTKWRTARPFTYTRLQEILGGLCGPDGYTVTLDGYDLTVKVNLAVRNQEEIVYQMLKNIVPANIELTVTLLYNTWDMFSVKTWNQVKTHTWEALKEGILT